MQQTIGGKKKPECILKKCFEMGIIAHIQVRNCRICIKYTPSSSDA